jgi:hypothetical protein
MRFLVEPVQAGDDARLYLQGIEGLAPGAYMNLQSNGEIPAGRKDVSQPTNKVVHIKSLSWDAEKRLYYATADVTYDHPAGTMIQNKHNVPGLAVHNHSNSDNQTFWLDARTFQYGVGDQFVVSATHKYQSNVFSGMGDEGAVCLNAEVIHDLDPFRADVESFDPATGRLVYKPGKTRSEKLALSRPPGEFEFRQVDRVHSIAGRSACGLDGALCGIRANAVQSAAAPAAKTPRTRDRSRLHPILAILSTSNDNTFIGTRTLHNIIAVGPRRSQGRPLQKPPNGACASPPPC